VKAIRGLCHEKRRLREDAIALRAQYEAVLLRFREGVTAGDKARALAYAIHDRLNLIRNELLPLVERRANELVLEYVELVRNGGGRMESFGVKKPARVRKPAAGDELRN
jgi:hypothetical protein